MDDAIDTEKEGLESGQMPAILTSSRPFGYTPFNGFRRLDAQEPGTIHSTLRSGRRWECEKFQVGRHIAEESAFALASRRVSNKVILTTSIGMR